jgi:hypothetical protein
LEPDVVDTRVRILTPEKAATSFLSQGYDVIVLLGQSNMGGRGTPVNATLDPPHPLIFQMKGKAPDKGTIIAAAEPLDNVEASSGIGPGFQFARQYVAAGLNGGRKVLLVPCAQGGTPLTRAAAPTWRTDTRNSLYDNAIAQTAAAAAVPGARVVAALWVQGETDGDLNASGSLYTTQLTALIAGIRSAAGRTDLPFIIGQMVPEYLSTGTRREIDAAQAALPAAIPRVAFVPGPANGNLGDGSHYSRDGQERLAESMAGAFKRIAVGLRYANGYTPQPTQTYLSDTFARADSSSLGVADTGQSWNPVVGTWSIANGKAQGPGTNDAFALIDSGHADEIITVKLAAISAASSGIVRVIFRSDSTGANHWMLQYRNGVGWASYKRTAGSYAQYGNTVTAPVPVAGDVVQVYLAGTSITIKVNGETIRPIVDSFQQAGTYIGIGVSGSGTSYPQFDDLLVTS